MKKKLTLALVLCLVLTLIFTGCQSAMLDSNVTIYADGSGVKTIRMMIYGDNTILAGQENSPEPGLVGNNSKYLLVTGDALAAKVASYSALEGIDVTVVEEENGNSVLTLSYTFTSIEDYYSKTKTLAKDNAENIEQPTFTDNGDGTFTFKENTENTRYAVDNLFYSLYNDAEAFSKDGQGDCNLEEFGYDYTCIYAIMSESATVGDQTTTVEVNEYNDTNTLIELDWADYIEVTGKPAAAPASAEPTQPAAPTEPAQNDEDGKTPIGLIIGIAAAVVVVGGAVAVVVIKKKKS